LKPRLTQSSAATTAVLTFFLISAGQAHAGVYDDAAAWWHFDYAPNYDPARTNVAQLNDIRDQMDWGTAAVKGASGKHATAVHGPLGGPEWTNCAVACPAGGQKYGDYSMWFHPVTNGLEQVYPDSIQVSNLNLPGSSTIVTRFFWNGFSFSSGYPGWIYNNALEWTPKLGWMFGVVSGPRLGILIGQTSYALDTYTVATGKWYDAAAVLTDNGPTNTDTVEFFIWPQDGTLSYKKFISSAVTNAAGSIGTIIGGEPAATSYGYATNGNNAKTFCGLVNHLAVWKRALSYEEVLEAFCHPQPLIQVGVNNGKDTEMRIESETDAEYHPGDPWHTLRRAVTAANPDVALKIPLNDLQTNLNYVLHLNTLNTSQTNLKAKLQLTVNNTTYPAQTAGRDQDLFWPIPKAQLVAGTNTFRLSYAGGTSPYVTFDWLELGGAWQIGTNNNSAGDFVAESNAGDHFYITDPNWQHLERAVVQGSDSNTVLHFALSPEMVSNVLFSYTTRIVQQGRNTGTLPAPPYPFSIGVNGRILYQSANGVPDNTLVAIPFAPGDLRAGANDINLMFNSTNGWLQFDFHRLETGTWNLPWPAGTLFFMR